MDHDPESEPTAAPDPEDFVFVDRTSRGPEHPGLPSPWAFILAFFGIAAAGTLGALIGFGIVNVDAGGRGSGTALGLGALVGGVIGALGAAVVAVVSLRARAQWRRRPIEAGSSAGPTRT